MNGLALCAGIGGLELGLHIAIPGYKTVCYVEREAFASSVIVARMEDSTLDTAPIYDDIETFDGKPWRGLVDIISAGDPCQPWSHAGQRKGYDDERVVFDDVARIVREVEPEFVFLENVAGAIDFRWDCKAVLEGMGYRVEAGLFSAAEVGAPHQRVRLFLLGQRLDESEGGSMRRDGGVFGQVARDVNESEDASTHLAHSESRCQPLRPEPARQQRGGASAESGSELADPSLSRIQRRDNECRGQEQSAWSRPLLSVCDSLPLFPPGPNDLEAWREILQHWPELEPAVALAEVRQDRQVGVEHEERNGQGSETQPPLRGMADGFAYRNDRLRCLGNAVVPLTAALAFRTLWGRLVRGEF